MQQLAGIAPLYKVVGGVEASEPTYLRDLWAHAGAFIVIVRRPGCWMCREQARGVAGAWERAVAERAVDQTGTPGRGAPRLVAIVPESVDNEDGSNEVEDFREFFLGEVFTDPYNSLFKALGDRQYTDGMFSREAGLWQVQRMAGTMGEGNKILGNFNGRADVALKFGGCAVVDDSGEIRYVHREAVGLIDYDTIQKALATM